jgi:hypothetical protein
MFRVLYVKFLRWIDSASPTALWKLCFRLICAVLLYAAVFERTYLLAVLIWSLTWNSHKIPLFCAGLFLLLNGKRSIRYLTSKVRRSARTGNQHTFHGVPVGALASFLSSTGGFLLNDAKAKLGLSQGQYSKIAQDLDKHGLFVRGPNNSRILRDISYEDIVRQLRDKFPLAWSDERGCWYEKNGTLERWAINQDFKQRKLSEDIEKRERKLEKIEDRIDDAKEQEAHLSPFQTLFDH